MEQIVQGQFDWLASLIMTNGEFIMHDVPSKSSYRIVPYFSNISCMVLLDDITKIQIAKKYLLWYISHLNFPDKFNVNGTIYDYNLRTNGELISTHDYDSYDSYPATFLSLCKKYFDVSKDLRFFQINKNKIDSIVLSMLSSMDNDNLTWAKPNWLYKYLMDNCEVYNGLKDTSIIYKEIYNDESYSNKLANLSNKTLLNIESKLWNNDGFYYPYLGQKNNGNIPNYKVWYPDATSQLFPILFDIISPNSQRAKYIYNNFIKYHPNWHISKQKNEFPDCYVCYVAFLMKDYDRVNIFLEYCEKNYINKGNEWPWFNVESSYYIKTSLALSNSKY